MHLEIFHIPKSDPSDEHLKRENADAFHPGMLPNKK